MRRFLVLASLVSLPTFAEQPPGPPLRYTLPTGWQPRGDLALQISEVMVDKRGRGGALVYRDESAGGTLQGAYGSRGLGSEDGASAKAAFQAGVAETGLAGWIVDTRERKLVGKSETLRVEAHDASGLHSITWSAAALDGKGIVTGLLQCIYKQGTSSERDCRSIIASAKLTTR